MQIQVVAVMAMHTQFSHLTTHNAELPTHGTRIVHELKIQAQLLSHACHAMMPDDCGGTGQTLAHARLHATYRSLNIISKLLNQVTQ
jgi:hypothetical protein